MVDLDVLVVGGGAIGGVTAALMTGQVRRVMVLDANPDHVARLRDPGLELDQLGEQRTVRLDAYADPGELPAGADFALGDAEGGLPRVRPARRCATAPRRSSRWATGSSRTGSPPSWGPIAC